MSNYFEKFLISCYKKIIVGLRPNFIVIHTTFIDVICTPIEPRFLFAELEYHLIVLGYEHNDKYALRASV